MEDKYTELELLSIHKASKILHISRRNVEKLIERGNVNTVQIGSRTKIPLKSIIEFTLSNDGRTPLDINKKNKNTPLLFPPIKGNRNLKIRTELKAIMEEK